MPAIAAARESAAGDELRPPAPRAEVAAIAPRGELRAQRRADADQLESVAKPRETDVVGRHAHVGAAKGALALLDRLPTLLERREIPSPAVMSRRPTAVPTRVERQTPADREMLDRARWRRAIRCRTGTSSTCLIMRARCEPG